MPNGELWNGIIEDSVAGKGVDAERVAKKVLSVAAVSTYRSATPFRISASSTSPRMLRSTWFSENACRINPIAGVAPRSIKPIMRNPFSAGPLVSRFL